jgi:hypothetical protein
MRFLLAAAVFVTALAVDMRPAPARVAHVAAPWCVIHNTGRAEWTCFPTRALCHRFGERPGGGAEYCVRYPVWSGRR